MVIRGRVPAEIGALFKRALEAAARLPAALRPNLSTTVGFPS